MNKVLENVVTTPIRLWMTLEGYGGPISILNLNMAYSLNTIPTANVAIAIGESITEEQATDIQTLVNSTPFQTATVILEIGEVKAEDYDKIFLRQGVYTIFEGYVNGKGTRHIATRSGSSISLNLSLVHKGIDIGMTSMFAYPIMSESSALGQHLLVDDFGRKNSETPVLTTHGFMYEKDGILHWQLKNDILPDLFGDAIVPHIQAGMKKTDRYRSILSPISGEICTYEDNVRGLAFVTDSLKNGGPGTGKGKLSIEATGRDWPDRLIGAMNMMAMDRNASAWNLLVRMGAEMGFSLIPTVDELYLAASSPVGPAQTDLKLTPDELWDWSISNSTLRLIKGLACFEKTRSDTNCKEEDPMSVCIPLPDEKVFENIKKYGLIDNIHFPGWIQGLFKESYVYQQYTGAPWAADFEEANITKGKEKTTNKEGVVSAQEFCYHWMGHELLKRLFQFRQGTLLGPLRFDILPGMILPLSVPIVSSGGSSVQIDYMANVAEVRFALQSGSVLTTIKLSHVRTQEEADAGTLESHYLFKDMWTGGGSLVKETA